MNRKSCFSFRSFKAMLLLALFFLISCTDHSQVQKFHQDLIIADLQNHFIYHSYFKKRRLNQNKGPVNKKTIEEGGIDILIFSLTIPDSIIAQGYFELTNKILDHFYNSIKKYKSFLFAKDYQDVIEGLKKKKKIIILGMQGLKGLEGDIKRIRYFYNRGIRMMSVVHNRNNDFGAAWHAGFDYGLTKKGEKLIKEMMKLRILIDVSHSSRKTLKDILKITGKSYPIVASHSNTYSICPHFRNLTDEQILKIKENEGLIGICFHQPFLVNKGKATVNDIFKHIDHIIRLSGENHVAIGTDFEGCYPPHEMNSYADFIKLTRLMLERGYSKERIQKIYSGNFLRILKKTYKN